MSTPKKPPGLIAFEDRGLGDLVREIAARHFCTVGELISSCKLAHVSKARRDLCTQLHDRGMSYAAIGRLIGRHHTSVLESCRRTRWVNSREGRTLDVALPWSDHTPDTPDRGPH